MAREYRNFWVWRSLWRENTLNIRRILILISIIYFTLTECSYNVSDEDIKNIVDDIPRKLKVIEAISGRSFVEDVYQNGTFKTGNSLWDNILNKCSVKPSVTCLQKNVYTYLDESLDFNDDISVSSGMCFKKNNVDVNKYSKEANIIYVTGNKPENEERDFDEDNEIHDEEEPGM